MKYVVTIKISYLESRHLFDDINDAVNFMSTVYMSAEDREKTSVSMTVEEEEK